MKNIFIGFPLLLFGLSGILTADTDKLRTVSQVDLNRYAGLWYEIAKIPNRFQKKCHRDTTAEYTLRPDGRINVVNRCIKENGREVIARGIGKIVETESNSKLKVSFVRVLGIQLFWGDYWIIGLEKNYQYAVVGDPRRKYGWILCRSTVLSPEAWRVIEQILSDQGYDPKRFIRTEHTMKVK
jgi:apolipoprotein D and lipocalin family protein